MKHQWIAQQNNAGQFYEVCWRCGVRKGRYSKGTRCSGEAYRAARGEQP